MKADATLADILGLLVLLCGLCLGVETLADGGTLRDAGACVVWSALIAACLQTN